MTAGADGKWASVKGKEASLLELLLLSDFTPVHCGSSRGVRAAGSRWRGLALFMCQLVPGARCPPPSPPAHVSDC